MSAVKGSPVNRRVSQKTKTIVPKAQTAEGTFAAVSEMPKILNRPPCIHSSIGGWVSTASDPLTYSSSQLPL